MHRPLLLMLLMLLPALAAAAAAALDAGPANTAAEARAAAWAGSAWLDGPLWACARAGGLAALPDCLQARAWALLDSAIERAEGEARAAGQLPLLERAAALGAELLPEAASPLLAPLEPADEAPAGRADGPEEARGKKKKKKKALMKILFVAMLIKNKLSLLFHAFSAFLQIKFFAIAILQLLIGLFRLYLELVKKKEPQKVIYYEHAQHQHHYEHEHHYDDDNKGWGGLWGRSYDEAQPVGAGVGAGVAPAGTRGGSSYYAGPSAHEQAYSSYLPHSAA